MKFYEIAGMTAAALSLYAIDRRLLRQTPEHRLIYFGTLAAGWALSLALILNPGLPGPTQLVEWLYGPLGKWLKK